MSSYVIFHAFLPNYQPPLFGCTYQYCHNFKYYEGKELVQGGGCNFLPCDVVDKFKCVDDLELKAEVENVIRGLAREATYLLKCKIHPIQSGDGSDVGADGECASVHSPPPPPPELPPSDKKFVTDKKSIANGFNKYYTSIGAKLADNIKQRNKINNVDFNFETFVKRSEYSFKFQYVSTDEILKAVQSLKNKTSFGVDGVSNVLLKVLAPYIINQALV